MPDAQLVQVLMTEVYDLPLTDTTSLSPYAFDWRGIFRVDTPDGASWVLRLLRGADAADDYAQTAEVLRWLERVGYAAPIVLPDRHGSPVGRMGAWHALLLSYVPGSPLAPTPAGLRQLGATLARLHALPLQASTPLRRGRTDLSYLRAVTLAHLERYRHRVPARYRPMADELYAATQTLSAAHMESALTHGDCWYLNAVETPSGGVGWPLLDLGSALLTSHYDLARPLHVVPDAAAIQSLVAGYGAVRPLTQSERGLLLPGVRWLLAFQLADYVAQVPASADDDPQLAKFAARFDATEAIAALVERALET